jgi:uncharacterized membrane protein YeaQ/YmgE (transglycosylase-associated protein family)
MPHPHDPLKKVGREFFANSTAHGTVFWTTPCPENKSPARFLSSTLRVSNYLFFKPHLSQEQTAMDGHGIIAWIIIGAIAGLITGKLMKGSGFGFFMDMVVGLIGAVVGGWLAEKVGIAPPGQQGLIISIVIAVVGAVILTVILRLITGGRVREL